MTKTGKKLAAVLLAVVMMVTFVPLMGAQTVHAEDYVWFSTADGLSYGQDLKSNGYAPPGYDGGVYVSSYSGNADSITIPSEVTYNGKTYCVTMIGAGGLSYFDEHAPENLTQVILPDSLREIGAEAFWGTNITNIDLPEGLVWIDRRAFKNSQLKGVLIIPAGVEGIGEEAFLNCSVSRVYCRTPESQTQQIGSHALGYYTEDDESYKRLSCKFYVYEASKMDLYAGNNGFTERIHFSEPEKFKDLGAFELNLSEGPLTYMPEEELALHMKIIGFLYAYGSENRSYFLEEGLGPDRLRVDVDKNGTWDLEWHVFKNMDHKIVCTVQCAETCSVEGTVNLALRNPKNRAIELGELGGELGIEELYTKMSVCVSKTKVTVPTGKTLTYTGKSQTGVATGTGYTVSGTKSATNAGTYKATVTPDEGYCWSDGTTDAKTVSWKINAQKITPAVTLSATSYTWNGKVKKPTVAVKNGSTKLAASDYTVTYKNNKNVGKASVTVKMKGNYSGSKTVSFKINPKGTSLAKLSKGKKAATVKWKKQSSKMPSRITGYQIQLATNKKFTKNKKTVTVKGYKKTSAKVTKLKGGKKYYVKVRSYKTVGGKKYYSPWSKVKTVKTKK